MAILIDKDTRVLIQGITGKAGREVTSELLDYGTKVVAGVTPGKGGQVVDTVPVFNSVSEAISVIGAVDVSMVYVPPLLAKDAAKDSIEALASQGEALRGWSGRPLVHIFSERMPIFDVCLVLAYARKKQVRILGPASVGAISPGEGKIGSIGGPNPDLVFSKGPVGIISKSGGMCSELAMLITNSGLGQSTVVGIGGDLICGMGFSDLLLDFEQDKMTRAVVVFGEVGGSAEIEAASLISEGKFTKSLIVFMVGRFAESLPRDTSLGHAGAIVGLGYSFDEKVEILKKSGAVVVDDFEEIPAVLKKVL